MLTKKDRELILFLSEHPLATYREIAHNISSTEDTAKRRYLNLVQGKDPAINGIVALTNPPTIGLETHTFFIEFRNDKDKYLFNLLHNLGQIHPYTIFQNRMFGAVNGTIMQFDIPQSTSDKILKMFNLLKQYCDIMNVLHFSNPVKQYNTHTDIKYWVDDTWEFDFATWLYSEESIKKATNMTEISSTPDNQLSKINSIDLILIRELMINSRRKQIDIMKDITQDNIYTSDEKQLFLPSEQRNVSRHLGFINQNQIIQEHRLLYNREKFQIFNQIIATGKLNFENNKLLVNSIQNGILPFRSSLRFYEDNRFLWWINIPPSLSTDFMNLVFSLSDESQISILDTKPANSLSFPIWHRNFSENKKRWMQNNDYMIHSPIDQILKE